ncbi:MAG: thiamine biosynthesis lipoprotein [Acidimicrobiaceae bacterium]|nr:thiamine biosynthesis lipoprotein [Acidimicrobiaceae bacterium]
MNLRAGAPVAPRLRHVEHVMGTAVVLECFAEEGSPYEEARAVVALARARAELHRIDAVFSTWKPDSPMSRFRRGELAEKEVPAELVSVLARCGELREATRGWFDPWALPGGVDPTGLVKGWAAGRALELLREAGGSGALVNAAGDVAVSGSPGGGEPWRIGIVDPSDPRQLAAVVAVQGSVATSGTYERGAHLVDPFSGRRRARAAAATVCGPDPGTADALATALAVGGPEALDCLEELPGYEALLIGRDGHKRATAGFPFARVDGPSASGADDS